MNRVSTSARKGSALVAVVVFAGVAVFAVGSVLCLLGSSASISAKGYNLNKAFYLADAGVAAAIAELNNGGDGVIPNLAYSRTLFADHSGLCGNWGFTTTVTTSPDGLLQSVTSQGQHGYMRTVRADVRRYVSEAIHALYNHAIYAGNTSADPTYVLLVGGTGTGADWVNGDVFCNGSITISGDAKLQNPETYVDANGNGIWDEGERFTDAHASFSSGTWPASFTNAVSASYLSDYRAAGNFTHCVVNGRYDVAEAFVDTIGNGVYDSGETFVDVNHDGVYGFGDTFTDVDGDGRFDAGEAFVDRGNGRYDLGEEFEDTNHNGVWDAGTAGHWERVRYYWWWRDIWVEGTAPESHEDRGNSVFDQGETFSDRNGVWDVGESYQDDRNGIYDYGTEATGRIAGMPAPAPGQTATIGYNAIVNPPELNRMYYELPKTTAEPPDALIRWGHDINVAAATFASSGKITDQSNPSHIFVKNPSNRTYTKVTGQNDYFLEDPTDASYSGSSQMITVRANASDKVYYVDGNVYLHNPNAYDFKFRNAGTKITIVADGNVTLSDEFYYNGGKTNSTDGLCLIARCKSGVANSGNIYLGDAQFGTGGEIHAFLYAEKDFVDNNLDTTGQPYLSVFGNMSAGNKVRLNRGGSRRTRLDVTLDARLRNRTMVPPGLPPPVGRQRGIALESEWGMVAGSWGSFSRLLAVPNR